MTIDLLCVYLAGVKSEWYIFAIAKYQIIVIFIIYNINFFKIVFIIIIIFVGVVVIFIFIEVYYFI